MTTGLVNRAIAGSDMFESLPAQWHVAPRRWGHPMHSLCSYMAMFPPALPHVVIRWLTAAGDTVYDPFCGRGTAPFEACLLRRRGLGSDVSPLAVLLTGAKVDPPTKANAERRLQELRMACVPAEALDVPDHIKVLFADSVLRQLLWLRDALDTSKRTDRFLLALLAGQLHLNATADGVPRGLTVSMPNTFAMAPGYVSRYIETHNLKPREVDVFDFLASKLAATEFPPLPFTRGAAWQTDATTSRAWRRGERPKLILTSPPYLEVIKYGKFNWIRLWLLGESAAGVDSMSFTSSSQARYLDFMTNCMSSMTEALDHQGYLCLVIGDVRKSDQTINLAEAVADTCVPEGFEVKALIPDHIPVTHKVSRIWKANRGRATKTDRLLVVARRGNALPSAPPWLGLDGSDG